MGRGQGLLACEVGSYLGQAPDAMLGQAGLALQHQPKVAVIYPRHLVSPRSRLFRASIYGIFLLPVNRCLFDSRLLATDSSSSE